MLMVLKENKWIIEKMFCLYEGQFESLFYIRYIYSILNISILIFLFISDIYGPSTKLYLHILYHIQGNIVVWD